MKINLTSIKDETFVAEYTEKGEKIVETVSQSADKIIEYVANII